MKKGCVKLVIFIPIVIGIIIYIIGKYGVDYWNSRKTEALQFVNESINEKFKELVPNKYSDSLKTEFIDYFNRLKNEKVEDVSKRVSEFYKSMENIVKDSIITELDFKKLKKMLDNNGIRKKIGN